MLKVLFKFCVSCNKTKSITHFYPKRRVCKKCKLKQAAEYSSTEEGYIKQLYNSLQSRWTRLGKHEIKITKREFVNLWKQHKQQYGKTCLITGKNMTHIRNYGLSRKTIATNISVDRLDNDIGYTKENIIFVTTEFNIKKNAVSILECFHILRQYVLKFPNTKVCQFIQNNIHTLDQPKQ